MAEKKATSKKKEKEEEKLVAPEKDKYNDGITEKNREIERQQKRINEIQKLLQENTADKDGYQEQKAILNAKISTYVGQIQQINNEKHELKTRFSKKAEQSKGIARDYKDAMRADVCSSEVELDEKIRQIEFEMISGAVMTLQEEKKKMAEIQHLKKQRPKIQDHNRKIEQLTTAKETFDTSVFSTLKEQIDALTAKCNEVWQEKEAVKAELQKLKDARDQDTAGHGELRNERDQIREKINQLVQERKKIRDDMLREQEEYQRKLQDRRNKEQERRREEDAKRRDEWDRQKKERAAEKLMEQPHLAETTLLEQTLTFCKSLLPKEQEAKEEKKDVALNAPEGAVVLLKG